MNNFYKDRYDFYSQTYWVDGHYNLLKINGFIQYPQKEYDYFVNIINDLNKQSNCSIMDIGCGNGLLLKHLIEHCHSQIIPFGIDFIELSIEQAKNILHSNYKNNFFVSNAIDFDFSKYCFDFILLDPYHFIEQDLTQLLQILIKQTSNSIIFYTYTDVLIQSKIKSVADFFTLIKIKNLQMFNYDEISIAILHSENK